MEIKNTSETDTIYLTGIVFNDGIRYEFKDGDLIYMFDNCQEKFEHSVRKKKVDGGERISIVFKKRI